jgi:hypothetical protein
MNKRALIGACLIVIACAAQSAFAQQREPRFEDYKVTEQYAGKCAPLVLTRRDREFRTRLREASQEKPDFAGHYIVAEWGCGAGCVMGAIIDAKTGRVYWLPFTVCCWSADVPDTFEPIEYRIDSSLIVINGARNEKEGDNGKHFYKFENGKFVLIQSAKK